MTTTSTGPVTTARPTTDADAPTTVRPGDHRRPRRLPPPPRPLRGRRRRPRRGRRPARGALRRSPLPGPHQHRAVPLALRVGRRRPAEPPHLDDHRPPAGRRALVDRVRDVVVPARQRHALQPRRLVREHRRRAVPAAGRDVVLVHAHAAPQLAGARVRRVPRAGRDRATRRPAPARPLPAGPTLSAEALAAWRTSVSGATAAVVDEDVPAADPARRAADVRAGDARPVPVARRRRAAEHPHPAHGPAPRGRRVRARATPTRPSPPPTSRTPWGCTPAPCSRR